MRGLGQMVTAARRFGAAPQPRLPVRHGRRRCPPSTDRDKSMRNHMKSYENEIKRAFFFAGYFTEMVIQHP